MALFHVRSSTICPVSCLYALREPRRPAGLRFPYSNSFSLPAIFPHCSPTMFLINASSPCPPCPPFLLCLCCSRLAALCLQNGGCERGERPWVGSSREAATFSNWESRDTAPWRGQSGEQAYQSIIERSLQSYKHLGTYYNKLLVSKIK